MLRVKDRGTAVCLTLILVAGAAVRLHRLDLMEFKDDEGLLYDLALQHARGETFMLTGLPVTFGGHDSPLNLYIFALPCLIRQSPLFCAGSMAVLNALAVCLSYLIARRLGGVRAGLAAALLFSASPWAIAYSRKIWPISLMPFCGAVGLLCFVRLCQSRRIRDILGLSAVLSVMTQVHYSAGPLILTAPASILLCPRDQRNRLARRWGWGALLFVGVLSPFLAGQIRSGFSDIRQLLRGYALEKRPPALMRYKLKSTAYAAGMLSRGDFAYHLELPVRRGETVRLEGEADEFYGSLRSLPGAMSMGFALLGWGLLVSIRRSRQDRAFAAPMLWLLLIPLASLALTKRIHPHYYAAAYPAQFVLAGIGFADVSGLLLTKGKRLGWLAAAALIWPAADGFLFYEQFLSLIDSHGGSAGEYGICYRVKRDVADEIARQAHGHPVALRDQSHVIGCSVAFRVLLTERGVEVVGQPSEAGSAFLVASSRTAPLTFPPEWQKHLVSVTDHPPLRLYHFRGLGAGD